MKNQKKEQNKDQGRKWFQIRLKYGPLAEALVNNQQSIINNDKQLLKMIRIAQFQKEKSLQIQIQIQIQGDTLSDNGSNGLEEGAYQYFTTYLGIIKQEQKTDINCLKSLVYLKNKKIIYLNRRQINNIQYIKDRNLVDLLCKKEEDNAKCPICRRQIFKNDISEFRYLSEIRRTAYELKNQGSKIRRKINQMEKLQAELNKERVKNEWLIAQLTEKEDQIQRDRLLHKDVCLSFEKKIENLQKEIAQLKNKQSNGQQISKGSETTLKQQDNNALAKYKIIKKIGKGTYGQVVEAEDSFGSRKAIKLFNKKQLNNEPHLYDYINYYRTRLMNVKSQYIVQLYQVLEDEKHIYFIMELCNRGDLLTYMSKQNNKVVSLNQTLRILASVIKGMEQLHRKGYLHRDLKAQHILLTDNEVKLSGFLFAKNIEDIEGTVLGSGYYMSPQIFKNQVYGVEVDMWSFGILMYFMLNCQFPFAINPHLSIQQKREKLLELSQSFSYMNSVKKSKKKLTQNCNQQIQDLFKRMFDPNPMKRITFEEIRKHKVFFQIYYDQFKNEKYPSLSKKVKVDFSLANQDLKKKEEIPKMLPMIAQQKWDSAIILKRNKSNLPNVKEREILKYRLNRIEFLNQCSKQLSENLEFIQTSQMVALKYNLLKYTVILLQQFLLNLNPQYPYSMPQSKNWLQYFQTAEFDLIKKDLQKRLNLYSEQLKNMYSLCLENYDQVKQSNPKIIFALQEKVSKMYFDEDLQESYRTSTSKIFEKIKKKSSPTNKYCYLGILLIICHLFDQIIEESDEKLRKIFYGNDQKRQQLFDFTSLRSWLSQLSKQELKNKIKLLMDNYLY